MDEHHSALRQAEAVLLQLEQDEAKAQAALNRAQQAKRAAQSLVAALREGGEPQHRARRGEKGAPRKTNMRVLEEMLEAAEPDGLLVSEVVERLRDMNHRLAVLTRDPLKAVSNELAELRRRGKCHKDRATGKYHPAASPVSVQVS